MLLFYTIIKNSPSKFRGIPFIVAVLLFVSFVQQCGITGSPIVHFKVNGLVEEKRPGNSSVCKFFQSPTLCWWIFRLQSVEFHLIKSNKISNLVLSLSLHALFFSCLVSNDFRPDMDVPTIFGMCSPDKSAGPLEPWPSSKRKCHSGLTYH